MEEYDDVEQDGNGDIHNGRKPARRKQKTGSKIIAPATVITSRSLMNFMGVNGFKKCSLGIKKIWKQPFRGVKEKKEEARSPIWSDCSESGPCIPPK